MITRYAWHVWCELVLYELEFVLTRLHSMWPDGAYAMEKGFDEEFYRIFYPEYDE